MVGFVCFVSETMSKKSNSALSSPSLFIDTNVLFVLFFGRSFRTFGAYALYKNVKCTLCRALVARAEKGSIRLSDNRLRLLLYVLVLDY
jgi:hypothetical protein